MLRRAGSHALHLLAEALLGALGILVLAGCVLVWRLAQGPIDITSLVRREQHRLLRGSLQIEVGSAALAWEGFRDPDSPLDIRFSDLRVRDTAGAKLAHVPAGRVTLATLPLWRARLVPRTVTLDGAEIVLNRAADGSLRIDLGDDAPASGPGSAPLVAGLTRPGGLPFLTELTSVRLNHTDVSLHDAAFGVLWHASAADIMLRRQPDGRIGGEAALDIAVGAVRARIATRLELSPQGAALVASLATPVSPAVLARAVPALAALTALDAPVTSGLAAHFDTQLHLLDATLSVQARAGTLHAGSAAMGLAAASAVLETDGREARLKDVRVVLSQAAGAAGPVPSLTGSAVAQYLGGRVAGRFDLALDHVAFADLGRYWPLGMGGGARPWITQNITAGLMQGAHVRGTLDAAADGSDLRLTGLSGTLDGRDMEVWWLRPVPPIQHADAHLTIENADALHIDIAHATQGKLALSGSTVRITGLTAKDQLAAIATHIGGRLQDVLALLNHPRLHLLSSRPMPLQNPAGQVNAALSVRLPLDADVTLDQIGIGATATLADVHLGGVAAGRDLDDGQLKMSVDTDELDITGTGALGTVPAALSVRMDFRNGPPSQVLERMTAKGRATADQFAGLGVPAALMTGGTAGFDVTYQSLRDSTGSVAIALDFAAAALQTPVGWAKAAGVAASASAHLVLRQDRLAGIDHIEAAGPSLAVASHLLTKAGRPPLLVMDRIRLGRTDLHGSVGLPGEADRRWRVMLRGSMLDLSGYLKQRSGGTPMPREPVPDDEPGPPWQADLMFDQVVLAKDEAVAPVAALAENDGRRLTRLDVTAGSQAAQVRATIQERAGRRRLRVDAADAGAVLLAAGVADNIRGGRLKLEAEFDDTVPHAPLTGTATLEHFRVTDAPAVGRLLKAMTLYGAIDLLRGPGLGFQKAVAPFRWQQSMLTLKDARAFSASLGLTAKGNIDLRRHVADVSGTVVPVYVFNQLPGRIPLLGKLFSPEKGGGVFAARYTVTGRLADPKVGVNPLSVLAPGFLRNLFGLL